MSDAAFAPLAALLDDFVTRGAIPAAQVCVIVDGIVVHRGAHGAIDGAPVRDDALFDVASLTKLVATTAAIAVLVGRGELTLDEPVARALPLFARNGKEWITVRALLAHASGLPAWKPLFLHARADAVARGIFPPGSADPRVSRALSFERAREIVVDAALTGPQAGPEGARVYSDLGFIALGELVSAVTGEDLDGFCAREVFAPLGAPGARYFDLRAPIWEARSIAPTGAVRPREPAPGQEDVVEAGAPTDGPRPGEVDDDNAYAMSGVAGHAGVFASAEEIARIGWGLFEDLHGAGAAIPAAVLEEMIRVDPRFTGPNRGLGFDRPAEEASAAGRSFGKAGPRGAVGHLGFTGTSLWLDLDRRCAVALLTNRTLPGRKHLRGIRALRPRVHDLVASILDDDPTAEAPTEPGAR